MQYVLAKKRIRPSAGDQRAMSFASRDGSYEEGASLDHRCPQGTWQWGANCLTEAQLRTACGTGQNAQHPLLAPLCATLPPQKESYLSKWGIPLAAGAFALGAFYFVSRKR